MPAINEGEVAVTLDGEEVVLRSTFQAAKTISKGMGGYTEAIRRVAAADQTAYAAIIAAGARRKHDDALEEAVYKTGLGDLAGPLVEYLVLLQNGGRDPSKAGDAPAGEA